MTDLERMGARFSAPEDLGDAEGNMLITGAVSAAKARGYAREVTSYTGGKGRLSLRNGGYEPCTEPEGVIRNAKYDPTADVENSPDSVFCSHGAGFIVPWHRVRQYMHIQTGMEANRGSGNLNEATPAERKPDARTTLEQDKELLAIFERTYGPVRPRAFDRPPKAAPEVKKQ